MINPLLILLFSTSLLLSAASTHFGLKTTRGEPLELLELKTKALAQGPYAEIQYIHSYKNPFNGTVETEFRLPWTKDYIFHKFEAVFQNQTIVGRILEKETAKMKSDPNFKRGETIAYSERNHVTSDMMNIKVGSLPPNETVEIVFSMIQPLKIHFNKFYELKLPAIFTLHKEWNIQVEIESNHPFSILNNPSHFIEPELSETSSQISKAVWNATITPNKDFIIYFGHEQMDKPQVILATSPEEPNNHVLLVNFLPDLTTFQSKDIQNLLETSSYDDLLNEKKLTTFEYFNLGLAQAEFTFAIDRGASMIGARFENLKRTLTKFLKMIPQNSYFNFVGFGASVQYDRWSAQNTPEALAETLEYVQTLQADLGPDKGREADSWLPSWPDSNDFYRQTYFSKIFIMLTGGDTSYPDGVIDLISSSANRIRFCSVGIDVGASKDFISDMAKAGNCVSEFIEDDEDIDEKVLRLLQAAVSQYAKGIQFAFSCFNDQNQKIYIGGAKLDFLHENQGFNKWVYLENAPNLKSCQATLTYYNSLKRKIVAEEMAIQRSEVGKVTDFWHKVAYDAKRKELERKLLNIYNWFEKEKIKSQIGELSVKYQILSNSDSASFFSILQESPANPQEMSQSASFPRKRYYEEEEEEDLIDPDLLLMFEDNQLWDCGTGRIDLLDQDWAIEIDPEDSHWNTVSGTIEPEYEDMDVNVPRSQSEDHDINAGEFNLLHSEVEYQESPDDLDVEVLRERKDFIEKEDLGDDVIQRINTDIKIEDPLYVNTDVVVTNEILMDLDNEIEDDFDGSKIVIELPFCGPVEVDVDVGIDFHHSDLDGSDDIDIDVIIEIEVESEENSEGHRKCEDEDEKTDIEMDNIDAVQEDWDSDSTTKESSGEGRTNEKEKGETEKGKETKEEVNSHKLADLKFVNTTNQTILVNSTQPQRISAPGLAQISDEKETENLEQNADLFSKKSLVDG